jgi:hypothetical protein
MAPSQASQASQASQVKSASARAPGTHITIDRRDRQNHQILLKAPNNDPPRPGCPLPLCHCRKRNALVRCPLCGEWIRTVPLRRSRWVGPCRPCSWLVPIVIVSPAFPFKCCRYSQAGTFRIVTPVSSARASWSGRSDRLATAGILLPKPTSSSLERSGLNCLSCAPIEIPFLARSGSISGAHQSVLCALWLLLLALLLGLCALLTEGLTDRRPLAN